MAVPCSKLMLFAVLLLTSGLSLAKTNTYDFTVEWVMRNPDNAFERPVMGINGQWPIPAIVVDRGDRVIVNVHNKLGNESTSLHFHGLYQNGTAHMDGPVGVSQCGIPPGKSFTYDFTVKQPGTYWYHSHIRAQYPDGLRGPFIVHDPDSPYKSSYDKEMIMTLSDWYHDQMPTLLASFLSVVNPTGAEPVPNAALMNDKQDTMFSVEPDQTYFFRIINMGAFAGQYLWFEGHTMQIIEVDGVYTEMAEADMIYLTAAQRYGVLVKARSDAKQNFAIVGSMDEDLFDAVPPGLNPNVTGYLVYDHEKPLPEPVGVSEFAPYNDYHLIPHDREKIFENPDKIVDIIMKMGNLGDGANYAFMNDITYVTPTTPTLYTVLSSGAHAANETIYGNTHPIVLNHNEVIEMRFSNNDPGKHPFHLHGHDFQAVWRSAPNAGFYHESKFPPSMFRQIPMRRDTMMVQPNGNFVIRFRSDNPGVWLYHCHIEWHVASGLLLSFIEAPFEMQKQLQGNIPKDHYDACRDRDIPIKGNAAGNDQDFFDLQGVPKAPAPLPGGFTARGIVALVFSCVSAFLGMVVISWYGYKPVGTDVSFKKPRSSIKG